MGKRAHVIVVPFPAQGHVRPLMKLAYKIASHDIKVTFVNTETIHGKIFSTTSEHVEEHNGVTFTSIPSGSREAEAENKPEIVYIMKAAMPGYLTELIEKINTLNKDEQITCVIADATMGWILDVGERLGIQQVAFCAASMATLALSCHIPQLILAEKIDTSGQVNRINEVISITEDIPAWEGTGLPWSFNQMVDIEKPFYDIYKTAQEAEVRVKWCLCNSSSEIEPAACNLISSFLPVGPLIETDARSTPSAAGSFKPEDVSCLTWLDKQPTGSVVYVSFGSIAVKPLNVNELACA
ncbi:hypothetical protein Leryth_021905 [Lithospermum erythrorhizon]|nr:hypothetical protein Leryth_021905 [Lithospermum erythrorhizon]